MNYKKRHLNIKRQAYWHRSPEGIHFMYLDFHVVSTNFNMEFHFLNVSIMGYSFL